MVYFSVPADLYLESIEMDNYSVVYFSVLADLYSL